MAEIVPLTSRAATGYMAPPGGLTGTLFDTTPSSVANLSSSNIAFISCDPSDYPGNIDAVGLLQRAISVNATAGLLYSQISDYCNYTNAPGSLQEFFLYSMTSANGSAKLLSDLRKTSMSQMYFATISHNTNTSGTNGSDTSNNNNTNPLGPSPSTAVAMIILYSITGIITALFLIIIVTGAVRAHRHPDQYGPRDVLGRPRQSRARGLARAMLDTLPIVKFGERDAPKPTDVELGSNSETRDAITHDPNNVAAETGQNSNQESSELPETQPTDAHRESLSGISPAQPLAAGVSETDPDEALGCSICTDDFEKGQDIRVLPCNHKFHPACVDPWLLNVSGTCPLCRIDLRPTTSRTPSSADPNNDDPNSPTRSSSLAPPLDPEAAATATSSRRRSAFRDMLSLHSRPNATAEERLAALRRLREQREHGGNGGVGAGMSVAGGSDDVADAGRRKRMSARLQEVLGIRTGRPGVGPGADTGAGASAGASEEGHAVGSESGSGSRSGSGGGSASGSGSRDEERDEERDEGRRDTSRSPTR